MGIIRLLTPQEYNIIAAGEVIESPVGAVKELIENSLDAGAKNISVEISNGGFDLVRVTDDGFGMDEDDLELAFSKHATSKSLDIQSAIATHTLGFRGEALPSIAAVSRIKITSRSRMQDYGVCLTIEAGKVVDKQHVSANVGTSIEVRDLFYNTPARKKFFKTPSREAGDITKLVGKFLLTFSYRHFTYTVDGEKTFFTNGNGIEEALFAVYGSDCLQNCLCVSNNDMDAKVEVFGYVGKPEYAKANRNYQTLSINGRIVNDATISATVLQAFKPYLMMHKFPFFVLNVDVPNDLVDINVHPKKSEVRLARSAGVNGAIYYAVEKALKDYANLRAQEMMGIFHAESMVIGATEEEVGEEEIDKDKDLEERKHIFLDALATLSPTVMQPGEAEAVLAMENVTEIIDKRVDYDEFAKILDESIVFEKQKKPFSSNKKETETVVTFKPLPKEKNIFALDEDEIYFEKSRILGVAFKTYLILDFEDNLYFIDQHAAHERLLFDKYMKGEMQNMQPIIFPYVFSVTDEESAFIEDNLDNLKKAGVEVQNFGKNIYRIVAVSTLFLDVQMKEFVDYLLSSMEDLCLDNSKLIVEKIAQKACKMAIKAGYVLNEYEIKDILRQIVDNKVMQCPHGRPVWTVLSKKQLEKMFKRIV